MEISGRVGSGPVPGGGVLFAALLSGCYRRARCTAWERGGLVFNVNPPEAEVVIDGVSQGAASSYTEDRYLKVSAGKHALELRLAGYETYSREIFVSNTLLRIETGLVRK
jgi:hypothetical protein